MRRRGLAVVVAFGFAAGSCASSDLEVKTARDAVYQTDAKSMLVVALRVAAQEYKVLRPTVLDDDCGVDQSCTYDFATAPQWYGPNGERESAGAGDFVNVRPNSVLVQWFVEIAPSDGKTVVVRVVPKTFQAVSGSPKPRELKPDDPYLPPWILGRADKLVVDIYTAAKSYAVSRPSA